MTVPLSREGKIEQALQAHRDEWETLGVAAAAQAVARIAAAVFEPSGGPGRPAWLAIIEANAAGHALYMGVHDEAPGRWWCTCGAEGDDTSHEQHQRAELALVLERWAAR